MDPNTNCKCEIVKDGQKTIHQYHFCGDTEFSLAHFLQQHSKIKTKMEYLGKGKIYSINEVLQKLPKQKTCHFWRIKNTLNPN